MGRPCRAGKCAGNKYYDSATGPSTQMDPIGLAGGLNLYGFASGDPINFSDPFGLSADTTQALRGNGGGSSPQESGEGATPSSSIIYLGSAAPGSSTTVSGGAKLKAIGQGVDFFMAMDSDGNVVLSASGAARLYLSWSPDPVVTKAAVNLGTGDFGVRGYLRFPFAPRFKLTGNLNSPTPVSAPSPVPRCTSMAVGLGPTCHP